MEERIDNNMNLDKKISLYCVPTPIGNLSDMSARCIEILKSVDFIAAEDTRNSGILLKHFCIKKPMISYHEHNRAMREEEIISRLKDGQVCALISDAGMPAISDPGEELVKKCYENNLIVSAIPGPNAAVTALAMSGISSKRFCFEGFLSISKSARNEHLQSLTTEKRTMIFYESPHRLKNTLIDFNKFFGNRKISIIREISKIYEQVIITTLDLSTEIYKNKEPRGEFVLVLEGFLNEESHTVDDEVIKKNFFDKIAEGKTRSVAAKEISVMYGLSKRDIYEKFKDK